jgi:hypothetical protein
MKETKIDLINSNVKILFFGIRWRTFDILDFDYCSCHISMIQPLNQIHKVREQGSIEASLCKSVGQRDKDQVFWSQSWNRMDRKLLLSGGHI